MPVYIALLRGVNVGQNILKMERLRSLCDDIGMKNACTYVQSGNVVFSGQGSAPHWERAIAKKLAGETRLPVTVIVRSAEELAGVLKANPFLREKDIDVNRLHVTFLSEAPSRTGLETASVVDGGMDRFKCVGKEIYLYCPGGYGATKLTNTMFEKKLGIKATTRNWNTVNELCEMAAR